MMKRLQGKTLMVLAQTVPCGVVALQMLLGLQPARAEGEPSAAVHLNEIEPSATAVEEWAAQLAQAELVEITAIQVEETTAGFTLRLETDGELAAPETSITGNAAIADIPNAVLNLAAGDEFFASDPAVGIALINVTNLPNNQVRIAITGTDAPPTVNITTAATDLTVSATPGDPTVQTPDNAIQIVVTGEQDGYLVPNASTATRTDTPLRDIPQSIQVIPRQVIEDQQAIGVEEVLENAAGVVFQGNNDGRGLEFSIRGFNGAPVLRDGFLIPGFAGDAAGPEVANLERVEVLRGPASVLYGQVDPGGVVNLVTKQPLSEPFYNLQFQVGNGDFISPSIDISGPLTEDGRLLYRLNALYRQEDSFRDYDNNLERFFIGPTLTWLISDQTDLTINLEYTEDDEPADYGTFAFGDGVAPIPLERVLNNPEDTYKQDYLSVGYTLEHRFSDNWQLRNQFRYTSSSYSIDVFPLPAALNESTGILSRIFAAQDVELDTYSLYTNIQGRFSTGSIEHTLLVGVDLFRWSQNSFVRFDPGLTSPINIFNPDYPDPSSFPSEESVGIVFDDVIETDQLGIYLQDQIDILDNLIAVAGLRYNTVNRATTSRRTNTVTAQYDDVLIPRIGIVYQPIEPISLYANYARSFMPNSELDVNRQPLEPEEGEGFEVGVRAELLEGRLAATLAYFDITKQNVATDDPTTALPGSVAVGEQRSRGVDFNLTGEILPGWNVVASYAYVDAEVTEDNNTDIIGNRLFSAPEHSASLWTTYEIQSGDLEGLGLGLGFNFVGEQQGDLANSFQIGSYFITNTAVFYRRSNWQVRLNIDNLFDVDYIQSVRGNRNRLYRGDPLTVRASVSYTF
ncbi:MAG: TonB-dependent siderophore receptor [Cyanobacteria bacterium P01_A01_bin.123]